MKKVFGLSLDFIAALLFIGLLAVVAVPNYVRRGPGPLNRILNNLRQIEGAKDQWALENKKDQGTVPTLSDLAPYLKNGQLPKPAVKEKYEINPVGTPASAVAPVKLGTYPAGSTIIAE